MQLWQTPISTASNVHDLNSFKHHYHTQHNDCANSLVLSAQPVLQWGKCKREMSLPGEEGNDKGGVSKEDGQDDHDLDDIHEVVAHCEAGHQGDEGVLGIYLAGTLCILLGLEICLHSHPGCSSSKLSYCL